MKKKIRLSYHFFKKTQKKDKMTITPQAIEVVKKALLNPAEQNLKIRPINECFVKSDRVTAKHILAKSFLDNETPNLPKLVLYIVMDQVFGLCNGKDANGDLGYYLEYVPVITHE